MSNQQGSTGLITVSVATAVAMTSFSDFTIRDAINRGELPAVRKGRRIAIRVGDLERWIDTLPAVTDAS
jgi:excisionase family DNA binding protein